MDPRRVTHTIAACVLSFATAVLLQSMIPVAAQAPAGQAAASNWVLPPTGDHRKCCQGVPALIARSRVVTSCTVVKTASPM